MTPLWVVLAIALLAFGLGRRRILALRMADPGTMHSLPVYHGSYVAICAAAPGLVIAILWISVAPSMIDRLALDSPSIAMARLGEAELALLLNDIKNVAGGMIDGDAANALVRDAAERYGELRRRGLLTSNALATVLSLLGLFVALRSIRPDFHARVRVERVVRASLLLASTLAILVTIGIVLSLLFETLRFFRVVSPSEFLFGLHWSPQTALRADQVGSSGSFGAVPVFTGTLLITTVAMAVAGPVGLLSAIYLNFYASHRFREVAKPLLEILAGVPTVVYGVFAALVVAPWVREWGTAIGFSVASESALAAGLVMGVMIIPFISSLSDDAITAVPTALRDGSFGLGATRSETIRYVMLPAALPGIMGGFLLAFSRAIGETMIVVMAAGLAANLSANPLDAVTTVTVQIVALLTGDQEFDTAKTLSAFALGLALFVVTLVLNLIALRVVQKYREVYD
jgi:phosphate transport system permease protein